MLPESDDTEPTVGEIVREVTVYKTELGAFVQDSVEDCPALIVPGDAEIVQAAGPPPPPVEPHSPT